MFVDSRALPNESVEADVCVIGAGAAGITIARELAGQSRSVVLLESGGMDADAQSRDLNGGTSTGLPYFPLATSRLRYFGGTTNHWGGVCRPFEAIDLERRSWVPLSGWPVTYAELEPYFDRTRRICNVPSAEWSADYWLARDQFPALPLDGGRLTTRVVQIVPSARRRFGTNHHEMLGGASNLQVFLHANVTDLVTNEASTAVTEARVACLSGHRFIVKARAFVLAAGGIENARLLLLSNTRQAAGLGNAYDQVGRCFMEHPRFVSGLLVPADRRVAMGLYGLHRVGGAIIQGYVALTEEVLRREELLDVQIDLDTVYEQAYIEKLEGDRVGSLRALLDWYRTRRMPDDFTRHVRNVLGDLMSWQDRAVVSAPIPLPTPDVLTEIWPLDADERLAFVAELFGDVSLAAYAERYGRLPIDHIRVTTRVEQAPNPESRVTLTADRDALGLRRAQLAWHLTPLDKRSIVRALEIFGAEVGRAGVGRLRISVSEDEPWPDDIRGGWHHMGTTRMSDDPHRGVVDRDCRVHGVANLFVAGSSVFPTAGGATPTFMLVALAVRLADHLKARV